MIRSLRWRLVLAMILIIGAVIATTSVFSSLTVKHELDRFLLAQRQFDDRDAFDLFRDATTPEALGAALWRVHKEFGISTIITDDAGQVITAFPGDMRTWNVEIEGGVMSLTRTRQGRYESIKLKGHGREVRGVGTVWFVPSDRAKAQRTSPGEVFRVRINRGLLIGLGAAALLAVVVMLTIFRRLFAPVEALTAGAQALAKGRLDARVDVRGHDEIAELARSFNSMAEALEKNERARRNMVSDVAHELRTPLTNIRVQVEAVQDGVAAADAKFLASVEEEVLNLSRLVDDLQQLSLADAGQLHLEIAEVRVAEIIDRAVSGLATNGIAIAQDIPSDLIVRADARRIVQAVRNLVLNALQYAKSEVRISTSSITTGVEIRVADDGPGIAPEHVDRIFDRFYRADPSRSRTTGGAGLGLAIVKQLVELHGGSVRYERPAFVIALPS